MPIKNRVGCQAGMEAIRQSGKSIVRQSGAQAIRHADKQVVGKAVNRASPLSATGDTEGYQPCRQSGTNTIAMPVVKSGKQAMRHVGNQARIRSIMQTIRHAVKSVMQQSGVQEVSQCRKTGIQVRSHAGNEAFTERF
jgi:hypothetical protein